MDTTDSLTRVQAYVESLQYLINIVLCVMLVPLNDQRSQIDSLTSSVSFLVGSFPQRCTWTMYIPCFLEYQRYAFYPDAYRCLTKGKESLYRDRYGTNAFRVLRSCLSSLNSIEYQT